MSTAAYVYVCVDIEKLCHYINSLHWRATKTTHIIIYDPTKTSERTNIIMSFVLMDLLPNFYVSSIYRPPFCLFLSNSVYVGNAQPPAHSHHHRE